MHSISTFRQLANIISDAVDNIEHAYERSGNSLPSLDQPFDQNHPAEVLLQDAAVLAATKDLVAAAAQPFAASASTSPMPVALPSPAT